jgi:hypothetical protein
MYRIKLAIEEMTEEQLDQYIAEINARINKISDYEYQHLVLKALKEYAETHRRTHDNIEDGQRVVSVSGN